MDRYNWDAIEEEKLNNLVSRRVIHTERMTVARLRLGKGAVVPTHDHVSEQITTLESGALRFTLGGEEIILHAGDVLIIPSGVPHGVETLEDSLAMDLFTPPREDWIRGDDAYLRK
ncbi:MAG: cupin domain-containing protein [Terriglobia bacterium]